MGRKQSKITRRAAIAGVGLATSALILRELRGGEENGVSSELLAFTPTHVTSSCKVIVNGYTVKVPPVSLEIKKPSDWDKFEALCKEATRKAIASDAGYKAHVEKQRNARRAAHAAEAKKKDAKLIRAKMEMAIRRFDAIIDNDPAINAANKQVLKRDFRNRIKEAYEASNSVKH